MNDAMPETIKNSFLVKTLKLTIDEVKRMLSYNIESAKETLKKITR